MGCVYFIRHGQTWWNVANKICGQTDIGLTPKGHEQAEATARKLVEEGIHADAILYSPLSRAADTAAHIAALTGLPSRPEDRLREQCFGCWEGDDRHGKEFMEAKKSFVCRYENGESMLQLAQRVYNLLDELKASGGDYILVAHNGIARVVHSYFYEMTNDEFAAFGVPNSSVTRYEFE